MNTATVAIDLAPLVNQVVVPLVTPVLMGFAAWALQKVGRYAHFQVSDGQRQMVETAISNGLAYAQARLGPLEQVHAGDTVATVAGYVLPKIPDALKGLGITPEHLNQLVLARLPDNAATPAQPPVPLAA